jgi:hypothetical protein
VRRAHEDAYNALIALREQAAKSFELEDLTNIAYAVHESNKFADDLEKETRVFHDFLSKKVGALWVAGSSAPAPIRTEYVTTTPRVKKVATVPSKKKEPEQFARLMTSLGVPQELWNSDSESAALAIHWPGLMEEITRREAEGLPPLDGIDPTKMYTQFDLTHRGRKGVDS